MDEVENKRLRRRELIQSQSALQHHALIAIIHSKVKLFLKYTE